LLQLQERDDISAKVAQQKMIAQMPTARKVGLATGVLRNDGWRPGTDDAVTLSEETGSASGFITPAAVACLGGMGLPTVIVVSHRLVAQRSASGILLVLLQRSTPHAFPGGHYMPAGTCAG
jgi:hypothetical protein